MARNLAECEPGWRNGYRAIGLLKIDAHTRTSCMWCEPTRIGNKVALRSTLLKQLMGEFAKWRTFDHDRILLARLTRAVGV
jgi:hypothetical protein